MLFLNTLGLYMRHRRYGDDPAARALYEQITAIDRSLGITPSQDECTESWLSFRRVQEGLNAYEGRYSTSLHVDLLHLESSIRDAQLHAVEE